METEGVSVNLTCKILLTAFMAGGILSVRAASHPSTRPQSDLVSVVRISLEIVERRCKGKILVLPNAADTKIVDAFSELHRTVVDKDARRCMHAGLSITSDHLGYFGYNPNFKAYIEVMSFDRLVNAPRERNRAFFDRLGLPAN